MTEIIIIGILLSLGAVFLTSYIIFIELHKNQELQRTNDQGREIVRVEKELDRTDAIERGLHMLNSEEVRILK
jgi:hypothetical protein